MDILVLISTLLFSFFSIVQYNRFSILDDQEREKGGEELEEVNFLLSHHLLLVAIYLLVFSVLFSVAMGGTSVLNIVAAIVTALMWGIGVMIIAIDIHDALHNEASALTNLAVPFAFMLLVCLTSSALSWKWNIFVAILVGIVPAVLLFVGLRLDYWYGCQKQKDAAEETPEETPRTENERPTRTAASRVHE
ncbi:hypothetical protein IKE71_03640 [Candidatus Saccharibacteria bacterium]|nr:hypothetical protein [Candidatus Saccharibacteria bacterium]